ncbi:MAG: hypothetical protein ABIG71_01505 [Candidatus Uhrbacteria bacterium]
MRLLLVYHIKRYVSLKDIPIRLTVRALHEVVELDTESDTSFDQCGQVSSHTIKRAIEDCTERLREGLDEAFRGAPTDSDPALILMSASVIPEKPAGSREVLL